jgi:MYXO-CTERM domain-containing protein
MARLPALLLLLVPSLAQAAPGPGMGNLECRQDELWKPVSMFGNDNGTPTDSPSKPFGHNVVIVAGGYLMLLYAPDSGLPGGGLLFYDVSDPRAPRLERAIRDEFTASFRETHSLPVARVGASTYLAVQAVDGVQFWDVSDAMSARHVASLPLEGVNGGDYTDVAWQLSWQYPYLYVAASSDGVFVVDARDPGSPQLVKRIPTSQTGGFRIGPVFALGDYLVVSNMDTDGKYALLDIRFPGEPELIDTADGIPKIYSAGVFGDLVYGTGRDGQLIVHRFDAAGFTEVMRPTIGGDGLYVSVQDEWLHFGMTHSYKKVDMAADGAAVMGETILPDDHADHGQTTPLGNLVFIGNDHGSGSALVCHAAGKDERPPSVVKIFPPDGTTRLSPTSRITVSFSDNLDADSVNETTFVVREAGGPAVAGGRSYIFNAASFGADADWKPDTTYEIVLPAGGIKDAVGNAIPEQVLSRFSTGDAIVEPPPPEPDAGVPDAAMDPDAAVDNPLDEPDKEFGGGCGCRTGGAPGGWLLALAGLLFFRRRRA